ncbi:MAG: glucosamine-6-phosphate deaminase [bacterium]|nr:glucosamine-6-phosphate deaminase [bacterium]
MRLIKTKNYEQMSRQAANIIAAQIISKPDCVLGLATGSTPIGMYQRLIEMYNEGDLDFSSVKTANLDEYKGLTRDNDQSYYYFMYNNLFKHVNINLENTNIPNGTEPDAQKECSRYDKVIADLGGVDLQLLGLGRNGHIGFNEPTDHFVKGTQCVDLQESTIDANKRFFEDISQVPRQAYTMGIGIIMSAKKILLIANGADKADALQKAILGPITPQVPASILQLHPDVTIIAEETALSKMPK